MTNIFKVLAEPNRVEILRLIRDRECAAGEIADHFQVTRTAISQHLRILSDAGLIAERRDGTRRLYTLRPDGLDGLRAFLNEFWTGRLQSLKRTAEQPKEKKDGRKRKRGRTRH
ncbi:MAG: metalloregulator ArsR/SmtB family transcription factor [Pirellulales bacterium]